MVKVKVISLYGAASPGGGVYVNTFWLASRATVPLLASISLVNMSRLLVPQFISNFIVAISVDQIGSFGTNPEGAICFKTL